MLLSLFAMQGTVEPIVLPPGFGADWLSHRAMPNQKAGCSWKLNVPPVPSCTGLVGGSVGRVTRYRLLFPQPPVFEYKSRDGASWRVEPPNGSARSGDWT